MSRFVIAAVAFILASGCGGGGHQSFPSRYSISDLGISENTLQSPSAINNNGQVAGPAGDYVCGGGCPPVDAFLVSDRSLRVIGQGTAFDLNDRGQVLLFTLGESAIWQDGHVTLIVPPAGFSYPQAEGINNNGQVVFSSTRTDGWERRAYIWENGRSTQIAPSLENAGLHPIDISDRGHVVGTGNFFPEGFRAALFRNGTVTIIGTLGGDYSMPEALNERDQVVGSSMVREFDDSGNPQHHAFLWDSGRLTDLGTLGGNESRAVEINESGEIVGYARNSQRRDRACVWRNGRAVDLNSLLPPDSRWELTMARAINDRGQIVGDGLLNSQRHMFLLTPN